MLFPDAAQRTRAIIERKHFGDNELQNQSQPNDAGAAWF